MSSNSNLIVFKARLIFNWVTDWMDTIVIIVLVTSLFRFKTCQRPWHGWRKGFGDVECVQPSKRPKRRKITRRPASTQATTTAGAKIAQQTEQTRERNDSQNNAKWHQVEDWLKNKQYQVAWLLHSDPGHTCYVYDISVKKSTRRIKRHWTYLSNGQCPIVHISEVWVEIVRLNLQSKFQSLTLNTKPELFEDGAKKMNTWRMMDGRGRWRQDGHLDDGQFLSERSPPATRALAQKVTNASTSGD